MMSSSSFTLEDSTTEKIPPILEDIVRKILVENKSCDSCQTNIMFVIIITLMVENGFVPLDEEDTIVDICKSDITENIKKWHTSLGTYEVDFILCGFQTPVKLIVSPLGATVLVNLVIKELDSETYSVCLPMSRYVVSPQASTIPLIFRDLRHLSITLKNKAISAVKSRLLSYHGYASASLIGLPEELLYNIIEYLPITDIIAVSKTCKRLNYLLNKEIFWHMLCKRDYAVNQTESSSWKILYQEKYNEQENHNLQQAQQYAGTMHDFMDYSDMVSYVDNPMWGVIL